MKQIIQDLKSGETILTEVPTPRIRPGHVKIRTHASLVSLGTEKMLVDFGKAGYIQKARLQPEKVREVIQKIKTDGLKPTVDAVFRKLGEPLPLGYSNAGEVIEIGQGVTEFVVGDRVVSNGHHAEIVCIPNNLVAKIPATVSYEAASFTIVGAIGLQGIRLIDPTYGETIVVIGLGLIGLISIQLLKANGCKVIGFDFDQNKVDLAKSWGIESYNVSKYDPVKQMNQLSGELGVDGVMITASTRSNEVISQAAQMTRKRGRIVLVGVIGLDINRSEFYEKELTFQVSCSYGPGRYDEKYENQGYDYPLGFVRWTEKRNFETILDSIKNGQLLTDPLITQRISLQNYKEIYSDLSQKGSIGSIITYSPDELDSKANVKVAERNSAATDPVIGIIGAGNFTRSTVAPILSKIGADLKYIASSNGLSGTALAKKYKIGFSTTDVQKVIQDPEINGVIITTRHNIHARQVIAALKNNKHVLVEKPLALTYEEITQLNLAYLDSFGSLTVGFNRRFSPFVLDAKAKIGGQSKMINVVATMNAGFVPKDNWIQNPQIGGGRIIGEACHYIDLINFLTGSTVTEVVTNTQGLGTDLYSDNASILLKYRNGSQGVINYFSDGNKGYPKENIVIFDQGKNIEIDNFRKIKYYGYHSRGKSRPQDKGHKEQFKRWINMIKSGDKPIISFDQIMNVSKAAIACVESIEKNKWISIE